MSKVTRSIRLTEEVDRKLTKLIEFYNDNMIEFSFKNANRTDIIAFIIEKEYEILRMKGYEKL